MIPFDRSEDEGQSRSVEVPAKPGTYILVLEFERGKEIAIGRLGKFWFPAGYYLYVGSALGPGGLAARLTRHLHRNKVLHWHIDHLLQCARLLEIWAIVSPERLECQWATVVQQLYGATSPVPGFGSSDCPCPSHLTYLPTVPQFAPFAAILGPDLAPRCTLYDYRAD